MNQAHILNVQGPPAYVRTPEYRPKRFKAGIQYLRDESTTPFTEPAAECRQLTGHSCFTGKGSGLQVLVHKKGRSDIHNEDAEARQRRMDREMSVRGQKPVTGDEREPAKMTVRSGSETLREGPSSLGPSHTLLMHITIVDTVPTSRSRSSSPRLQLDRALSLSPIKHSTVPHVKSL